jgi:hypothetical protein
MLRLEKNPAAGRPAVSIAWAALALALFLLWQFLTVHYNRAGNWTALFLSGKEFPIPPDLAPGTYQFPGRGFDGQMYRYVAHDLFLQFGYAKYMDTAAQRYHRILVPALSYLLVGGHQPWIDASYIAVIALFVLLGAYWLSRWAAISDHHPAWALAFLLVPATLISMDRMTVDVALAALTVAFAFYWRTGAWTKLFVVLTLACLVRETGAFLAGACCLAELLNRRIVRAVAWASSVLPMFAWYLFVRHRFVERSQFGIPAWVGRRIAPGIFHDLFQPPHYPLPPFLETIARAGDVLSLAGILLAVIGAILYLRRQPRSATAMGAIFFAAFVLIVVIPGYWNDINGYGRVFSPLLLLVALGSLARETGVPWWTGLIPTVCVDLRLGMEFTAAAGGILRGLLR